MAYSTNIKQLLDCEAEAQAIINEAKQYRLAKLKQVKKDVAEEVAAYKISLNKKNSSASDALNVEELNAIAEKEVEEEIKSIKEILKSEKADLVVQNVIIGVVSPVSDIHVNAQK
ncbi:hypothetical protein QEN19_001588 [Hanseniaspora menglaensis]